MKHEGSTSRGWGPSYANPQGSRACVMSGQWQGPSGQPVTAHSGGQYGTGARPRADNRARVPSGGPTRCSQSRHARRRGFCPPGWGRTPRVRYARSGRTTVRPSAAYRVAALLIGRACAGAVRSRYDRGIVRARRSIPRAAALGRSGRLSIVTPRRVVVGAVCGRGRTRGRGRSPSVALRSVVVRRGRVRAWPHSSEAIDRARSAP